MENPLINKLNTILTANYDAERGYKEAAQEVDSPQLKGWFIEFAKQRYDFGHNIKREIASFGGEVNKGTSLKADAHRAWMDLKSAVSSNDEKAILSEVVRGEKDAISRYDDVMAQPGIPASTRNLLINQKSHVESALAKVKTLENQFETA